MFNFVPPTILVPMHPTKYILVRKGLKQLMEYINKRNKEIKILNTAADAKNQQDYRIKMSLNRKDKNLNAFFLEANTNRIKEIKDVFNDRKDMWILKPTGKNRGNGIDVKQGWKEVNSWLSNEIK